MSGKGGKAKAKAKAKMPAVSDGTIMEMRKMLMCKRPPSPPSPPPLMPPTLSTRSTIQCLKADAPTTIARPTAIHQGLENSGFDVPEPEPSNPKKKRKISKTLAKVPEVAVEISADEKDTILKVIEDVVPSLDQGGWDELINDLGLGSEFDGLDQISSNILPSDKRAAAKRRWLRIRIKMSACAKLWKAGLDTGKWAK